MVFQNSRPGKGGPESLPQNPRPSVDTSVERRELMPISPTRATMHKILDDVFGKGNREKVLENMDSANYEEALMSFGGMLNPPYNYKYKGTMQESGKVIVVFDDNGKEVKRGLSGLLFTTDEKIRELLALTKTPVLNTRALERQADTYILGRVIEMVLHYGPDDMPDDILDRILSTDLIASIRRPLVESYKRGKPYKMTTIDDGFMLETDDPKDPALPDMKYDMVRFWRSLKLEDQIATKPTGNMISKPKVREAIISMMEGDMSNRQKLESLRASNPKFSDYASQVGEEYEEYDEDGEAYAPKRKDPNAKPKGPSLKNWDEESPDGGYTKN